MGAGLTGGCQCGAVRYRLEAEPIDANVCHCRMCQKASGAPFMAFAGVSRGQIAWTRGAPQIFASSAIARRGFCRECGTPLTYEGVGADHISVTLGSLDHPDSVPPRSQLGVESRLCWLARALTLPEMTTDDWLARKHVASVGSRQHPDRDA